MAKKNQKPKFFGPLRNGRHRVKLHSIKRIHRDSEHQGWQSLYLYTFVNDQGMAVMLTGSEHDPKSKFFKAEDGLFGKHREFDSVSRFKEEFDIKVISSPCCGGVIASIKRIQTLDDSWDIDDECW